MTDKDGFLTHEELGIKFKYQGGRKSAYADTVTGVIIKGVKSESDAKAMAINLSNETKIYESSDDSDRNGWWMPYFRSVEKISEDEYHVFWVMPFND